ncbi:hypothetical protein SAMN05661086_01826, partial [Anaeromicropila populeti]
WLVGVPLAVGAVVTLPGWGGFALSIGVSVFAVITMDYVRTRIDDLIDWWEYVSW